MKEQRTIGLNLCSILLMLKTEWKHASQDTMNGDLLSWLQDSRASCQYVALLFGKTCLLVW